jgi:hypothetical protein
MQQILHKMVSEEHVAYLQHLLERMEEDQVVEVVSSLEEVQVEDHMEVWELMGASPLEEPLVQEFQEKIMVAAHLAEVEVGGNVIYLGVKLQAVKLESRLVRVLEVVA